MRIVLILVAFCLCVSGAAASTDGNLILEIKMLLKGLENRVDKIEQTQV